MSPFIIILIASSVYVLGLTCLIKKMQIEEAEVLGEKLSKNAQSRARVKA
jgi:hypothetical protein